MKLKFISPANLDRNIKATAHKTGKLGFTVEAAEKLKLSVEKSAAIAINEEDKNDLNLYVVINDGKAEGSFNISKAGGYYYINTKTLFDNLKVNYLEDTVVYDISEEQIEGQMVYKFKRRDIKKENKE